MSSTTFNQDDIDNNIDEIFTECLIQNFIETIDCDYSEWYNFDNEDDYYDYIDGDFIQNVFNIPVRYGNIFYYYNKDYTLDFKTSIKLLKYIKGNLVDDCDQELLFCEMFDENVNSETKIINNYAYWLIRQVWGEILEDRKTYNWLIIKIIRNIAKYNFHKKKHSGLINLYTKLYNKNKQKKTISKILNDQFDTDILQTILQSY
tara:strand:- start:755 stop:1366 length:612 start_codon:yes stop_codon:yes gene_type:complete